MTQNDESTTSGYEVDASTEWSTNYIWRAFDNDVNTFWHADHGSTLWNSSGDYVGSVELITGHKGDWITVKLPTNERISPRGIRLSPRGLREDYSAGQAPKDVVVIGSNDGSSWVDIATTTLTNYSFGISPSNNTPDGEEHTPATFDFEATEYYQYVGIIIKSIYPGGHTNPSISQLEFLGIPEYDSDAHGTDVVVKSEANVPNTDWLEVYYEGKNYTNGAVQDETGNNRNGTLDGVTYDSVSESFTFVSGNKITAGPMTPFTSGTNYTASMWFKVSEIVTSQKLLFHFGHGDTGESFGLNIQNGNIGHYLWGGSTKYTVDNLYTANEWVHAVGTINGSTAEVYVNGHLRLSYAQDITTTIPTDPYLSLGIHFTGEQSSFYTSGFFTGSIANFRLFNRALASDEIWQLYTYQKEYFGHGDLSMTLKAGRLGIGTSEPRAALDVRGDIHANGGQSWPIPTAVFSNVTPSNTGSAYYSHDIGTQWVYFNTVYYNNSSETIGSPPINSREITLKKPGMYEFYTESSIQLQGSAASHMGVTIRDGIGGDGIATFFRTDGYEVTQSDYNTVKLVHRTHMVLVQKAPCIIGYYLQPIANYTDRYTELAYGNSKPIHTVIVKYLG